MNFQNVISVLFWAFLTHSSALLQEAASSFIVVICCCCLSVCLWWENFCSLLALWESPCVLWHWAMRHCVCPWASPPGDTPGLHQALQRCVPSHGPAWLVPVGMRLGWAPAPAQLTVAFCQRPFTLKLPLPSSPC